jgi:hypothetical protein
MFEKLEPAPLSMTVAWFVLIATAVAMAEELLRLVDGLSIDALRDLERLLSTPVESRICD